jgi:hypothetical protein
MCAYICSHRRPMKPFVPIINILLLLCIALQERILWQSLLRYEISTLDTRMGYPEL